MAKPKIEVLSREEIEEIHARSLSILSKVGVMIDHDEALKILKEAGAEVDFNRKIAKIPEYLIREALKKLPSVIKIYYRDGKRYIELRGRSTYFALGSTAFYYVDWKTDEIKRPSSRDLADVAKIIDALPNIHIAIPGMVPGDVPEIVADRWRTYVVIKNSSKPMGTSAFTMEGVPDLVKLWATVVGRENVSRKPFYLYACPSPPLKWSDVTTQIVLDSARYGIPVHIIPMPQTGATAPATLAGAIVEANAEFLSGVVIAQFTKSGTPIIYSGSACVFDQRYATACTGYIEVGLMAAAFSQIAKFYGVPSSHWIMSSDAKTADPQATLESAFGALIATLSGLDIAIGAGMLLEENAISPIKLVIDDDIAGSALRFARGIHVDVETLADWLIEEVGPGGHFLKYKHTREWWKKEHFIPKILDKTTTYMWKKCGSKTLNIVAKEYVEKILKEHVVEPLPPDIEKELDKTMLEILKRYGIEKLPQI